MIKIAPGTYLEPAGIVLKNYVDIEGSGQTNTIITAGSSAVSNTTVRGVAGALNGEIRNLTITNTGGGGLAVGLWLTGITPAGGFRVSSVTVTASGSTARDVGTRLVSSSPTITNLTTTATATGGSGAYANWNSSASSPTMTNVAATATANSDSHGVYNEDSSPAMNNLTATATGNSYSYGVFSGGFSVASSPTIRNSSITGRVGRSYSATVRIFYSMRSRTLID